MSVKKKYIISMVLLATFLLMAVEIKGVGCPGDYILRAMGMKAWSGGDVGTHMIVIYMIIPVLISGLELGRHRRALQIGRLKSFVLLVLVIILINNVITQTGVFIKSQSGGLYAVGLIGEDNRFSMKRREGVETFELLVTIKNFSNEEQSFTIALDSRFRRREGQDPIRVVDATGQDAYFVVGPKRESRLHISSDQYNIHMGRLEDKSASMSRSGGVAELIISNKVDGSVRIYENELRAESLEE